MKLGIINNLEWAYIASVLANEEAEVQATFLRSFIEECKSWGTNYQVGIQFAAINKLLTDDEKKRLSTITYQEESK